MEEKIRTLHPQGKAGVNISKRKYDQIKEALLMIIDKNGGEISYKNLTEIAEDSLKDKFDGKVGWSEVTVKLDLEARKIIERIPKTSLHCVRLMNS